MNMKKLVYFNNYILYFLHLHKKIIKSTKTEVH